jgi:hypothetical protein
VKPTEDGFYWLHTRDGEATLGGWQNAYGWTLLGQMGYFDPDDPAGHDVRGGVTLGSVFSLNEPQFSDSLLMLRR